MMHDIGGYRVVRQLGKGGMSEVYEVENERLGSRHALKLFTCEQEEPEIRNRFLTEEKLLARLNHPRIVRVTDLGTDAASGRPYFVMDLVLDGCGQTRSLVEVEPGTADEEEIGRWYDDLRKAVLQSAVNHVLTHTALSDRDRPVYRAYAIEGRGHCGSRKEVRHFPKFRQPDQDAHRQAHCLGRARDDRQGRLLRP